MPCGFFITLEGLDGCGKTTQSKRLAAYLRERKFDVITTRQPGGTPFGDKLRSLLLDSRAMALSFETELALMFADRAQCIQEVIAPALERGAIVICDRFTDSTEAYQGGGRGLGSAAVLEMHRVVCGNLQPDLTLLLEPGMEGCLERARERNKAKMARGANENRFEQEQESFFRAVAEKYREIAVREPQRVVAIQGDGTIAEVHARILEALEPRLHAWASTQEPQAIVASLKA
jgi:dTMP kinase